jgi:hypothetical protein
VYLAGSYVGPDPGPGPSTGKPMIAVSGALLNGNSMTGTYEGIPWTISTFQDSQINGTLVLNYGNSAATGQSQEVVAHVVKFTPANPTANPPTPDTFTIDQPFPTPPPQSPFPIRPIWSGKPGNPGPVTTWPNPAGGTFSPGPRFDPRAFPWVVRYFSVIN